MRTLVQNAQVRHFQKWPILGKSGPAADYGPVATTYYGEIDSLKSWISTRLQWLDANISGLCVSTGVAETNLSNILNCYPNPANDYFIIEYSLPLPMYVSLRLYDCLGTEVLSTNQGTQSTGQHSLKLETATLSPGIYILKFERGTDVMSKKIIVLE